DKKAIQVKFNEEALKEHGITIDEAVAKIKEAVEYEGQGGKTITIKPKVETLRNVRKVTNKLQTITLKGIPGISRAIIIEKEGGEYALATEGSNLEEVFKIEAVNKNLTTTNDIMEISKVLGVEAARNAIIAEILKVMEAQDLDVDIRHIMLIADSMTANGMVESIGRHGLAGKKASILARAAFEETAKHLVNACVHGESDKLTGIAENIIIGQTIPCGTGIVELEMDVE
ncbi:MAG: intein-containing DNA-directed RNA polymerase subunit A'', partial [Candidatus Woesearchaeota archaeon]|nr:intein-containing DNA-directed RNA polymerase subunit A'' [Candidatus Woesearchaeota archaeon]